MSLLCLWVTSILSGWGEISTAHDSPSCSGVFFWDPAFCPFPGLQHWDVVLSLYSMVLDLKFSVKRLRGVNPCKLKMRRWYSPCWHPLWLFIMLTIYSLIPRTPAQMKQGDQSNKLIVLNLVYIMVLRVENADVGRLGTVRVLLDILRYQKNNYI